MSSSAEPDPDQQLEFRILGPLEVVRAGSRLALGGRQQRAVLAILLCDTDASVSVDRLADALWGENPPGGYLTTLQTYVFHLRAALEPGRSRGAPARVLATEPGGGYRLHLDGVILDATTFERMAAEAKAALDAGALDDAVATYRRALDLWRGDVLADLADVEVVRPVAARLEGMRVAAFENLIDGELALRRHAEVLPELERLVSAYPLRERIQAQRILALYRSGRQAEALNAYNDLRSTLRDELGIDPSPPLQELYRAVLAQDPTLLDQTPAAAATPLTEAPGAPQSEPSSTPPSEPPSEPRSEAPRRWPTRRTSLLTAAVAVVVATTVATTAHLVLSPSSEPKVLAANSLGEIGTNGEVRSSVPVGTDPVGVVYADGLLWVANRSDKSVSRVDPKSGAETRVVRVGGAPESLAVTAHDLWVANRSDDTVSRINLTAAEVVDTIAVGDRPAAMAAGPSGVWVANSGANTIQRIDPTTGAVDPPIAVGDGPDGIAVDRDSVWVANGRASTVWRINPRTRAHRAIRVGDGPRGISVVGDEVWVANQLSQSVTRISRTTERARSFVLGDGPAFVAAVGGSVWVSEQYDGALTRVDRASGRVDRFAVNGSPRGLAAVGDRLWVATGAFSSAAHRGGTLTFASSLPPGDVFGIDPANAYDPETLMLERLVYDGLVGLASSGDFPVLVPDLATSLPSPTKGGTVYTFTLRPGIRYSDGRSVKASDFVLSVRRALAHGERRDFYESLVGAGACHTNASACDLSRGVLADDANGTLTFVLTAPDPEFLYKLSMFIFPAAPGTPLAKTDIPPVGTGPYTIAEYTPKKSFELRRNMFFHQWSFAAQPAGYPEAIRWLKVPTKEAAAAAVTEGRADLTLLTPLDDRQSSGALVERIHKADPQHVHTDALPALEFEVLGTKGPPFNNLKVRQALNYAVDRNVLVDRYGGPSVALPTCQLVPASLPGFQWRCPYTVGPDDGKYHGPDMTKARRLVAESGTRGASVTVHYVGGGVGPPFDDYLVDVLNQLGYHARLERLPNNDASNTFIYNGDPHFQATDGLWITDYPLVSNLYYGVVACGAYAKQYCNRQLDEQAAKATLLQETDPAAAHLAWVEVDRQVVEAAAIVPGTNALDSWYTSARTGNFQVGPLASPLIGQLWVQ